jgi:phage terminase small subunit
MPKRVQPPAPVVKLTERQEQFARRLAKAESTDLWDSMKYLKLVAKESGYTEKALATLTRKPKIFDAATYLRKGLPITIERELKDGSSNEGDPDRNRQPGEPLKKISHERFCQEIVADPAARIRNAARRVGYEETYASSLYKNPKIKQRIAELQEERKKRLKVSADDVLMKLVNLTNVNIVDLVKEFDGKKVVFHKSEDLTRDELYGVREIKHRIRGVGKNSVESMEMKLESKQQALNLLAKHLGLVDQITSFDPTEFAAEVRRIAEAAKKAVPGGEI